MIDLDNCRVGYRERPCLVPDCKAGPCCAAHWPKHRGHGGHNADWAYNETVPLCFNHHEQLDARNGTSTKEWAKHLRVQAIVEKLATPFWASVQREAEAEQEAVRRLAARREAERGAKQPHG